MAPASSGDHVLGTGGSKRMSRSGGRSVALRTSAAALLGVLGGCYSSPSPDPGPVVMVPVPELGQANYSAYSPETYLLRPNDVITVLVFREPELSMGGVPVSATGDVSLPLVGPMHVAGLTSVQLETRLEDILNAQYLQDANVTINVQQYNSHRLTVEGSVNNPGLFTFSPGTRLSGGLALAGGLSIVADEEKVAVFRETPEGIAVAKFDYDAVQNGTMFDPVLQPGDRIVVGLDILSQFWQDLLSTLPAVAFFRAVQRF